VERMQTTTAHHHLGVTIGTTAERATKRPKRVSGANTRRNSDDEVIALIDAARIEQVLTNLITNAVKYSPDGGPVQVMLARRDRRTISDYRRGLSGGQPAVYSNSDIGDEFDQYVEIQVQDEGLGIPADQQSLIFGRFMRANNVRQSSIRGTGLGLYISRGLVEQHGGRIWFESHEGEGTTFYVILPVAPIESPRTTE